MKELKDISKALSSGDVDKAHSVWESISDADEALEYELHEIVRQAIISYLKKGHVYKARQAEALFGLPKDAVDEAIKQAVLSSFRDGDVKRVRELRDELPINKTLAGELVSFCASWGKQDYVACMQEVLA